MSDSPFRLLTDAELKAHYRELEVMKRTGKYGAFDIVTNRLRAALARDEAYNGEQGVNRPQHATPTSNNNNDAEDDEPRSGGHSAGEVAEFLEMCSRRGLSLGEVAGLIESMDGGETDRERQEDDPDADDPDQGMSGPEDYETEDEWSPESREAAIAARKAKGSSPEPRRLGYKSNARDPERMSHGNVQKYHGGEELRRKPAEDDPPPFKGRPMPGGHVGDGLTPSQRRAVLADIERRRELADRRLHYAGDAAPFLKRFPDAKRLAPTGAAPSPSRVAEREARDLWLRQQRILTMAKNAKRARGLAQDLRPTQPRSGLFGTFNASRIGAA